ncbi:MAG: hypothetical protein JSR18_14210 [Proteobacteria bacterium]|nr:hypothetical protein [Pseudomonadota bacterium]
MTRFARWLALAVVTLAAPWAIAAREPDASVVVSVSDGEHVLADLHASGAFGTTLSVSKPGVIRVAVHIERPDDRGWSMIGLKVETPQHGRWHTEWQHEGYLPLRRSVTSFCLGPDFTYRKPGTRNFVCVMPRLGRGAPIHTAREWPSVAQRKLDAVHTLLTEVHPAAARDDDPAFTDWLQRGYVEASVLARQATSESTTGGVIRYYVAGFRDEHLRVAQPEPAQVGWTGWRADFQGNDLVVVHVAAAWDGPLPAAGAVVESCDGADPRQYILTTLAAFNDRRVELSSVRSELAGRYTVDPGRTPGRALMRTCVFSNPDGSRQNLPIRWKYYPRDVFPDLEASGIRATRNGTFAIEDLGAGRYWVRLPSFIIHTQDKAALDAIAERLATLPDARWVVFDVRGNDGGDSKVGSRLLDALTGGLDITDAQAGSAPKTYALWRVSAATAAEFNDSLADALRYGGIDNPSVDFRLEYSRRFAAALAAHEPWLRQEGGVAITPALVEQWDARPRHYAGRIALVADDACFSACLDFVDEVMLIPGTLRLGHTTAADTRYTEVGLYRIDDDLSIQAPRKVWIGRPRGNNVPYVPDRTFAGPMNDDAAVRRWVLDQLP